MFRRLALLRATIPFLANMSSDIGSIPYVCMHACNKQLYPIMYWNASAYTCTYSNSHYMTM